MGLSFEISVQNLLFFTAFFLSEGLCFIDKPALLKTTFCFSGLTAISTYLLTKEIWSAGAGLFAACFIAIVPGYISRSVAGSYDNEGIAIFALQFTYYLWVSRHRQGSSRKPSQC